MSKNVCYSDVLFDWNNSMHGFIMRYNKKEKIFGCTVIVAAMRL